jgi:hypothetical protein
MSTHSFTSPPRKTRKRRKNEIRGKRNAAENTAEIKGMWKENSKAERTKQSRQERRREDRTKGISTFLVAYQKKRLAFTNHRCICFVWK